MQQCCGAASQQETADDLAGTGIRYWSGRRPGRPRQEGAPPVAHLRTRRRASLRRLRPFAEDPYPRGRAFGHPADECFTGLFAESDRAADRYRSAQRSATPPCGSSVPRAPAISSSCSGTRSSSFRRPARASAPMPSAPRRSSARRAAKSVRSPRRPTRRSSIRPPARTGEAQAAQDRGPQGRRCASRRSARARRPEPSRRPSDIRFSPVGALCEGAFFCPARPPRAATRSTCRGRYNPVVTTNERSLPGRGAGRSGG